MVAGPCRGGQSSQATFTWCGEFTSHGKSAQDFTSKQLGHQAPRRRVSAAPSSPPTGCREGWGHAISAGQMVAGRRNVSWGCSAGSRPANGAVGGPGRAHAGDVSSMLVRYGFRAIGQPDRRGAAFSALLALRRFESRRPPGRASAQRRGRGIDTVPGRFSRLAGFRPAGWRGAPSGLVLDDLDGLRGFPCEFAGGDGAAGSESVDRVAGHVGMAVRT